MDSMAVGHGRVQRGLLLRHSGGCLSPRVLDFLCFDTPRSVLGGEEGEEELPFYLAAPDSLEQLVEQVGVCGRKGREAQPACCPACRTMMLARCRQHLLLLPLCLTPPAPTPAIYAAGRAALPRTVG